MLKHPDSQHEMGFDPEVRFEFPLSGLYQTHVGALSEEGRFPATVSITEIDRD